MTLETLKLLCYSLFYSFISYCICLGSNTPSVLDQLIKLQKKVIRAILFNYQFTQSTLLFSKLQILKLNDIHSLQLLFFLVSECVKGPTISHFKDYLTPISSVHGHFTHQASQGNIFTNQVNITQYGLRSVRYAGALLWNKLPLSVRDLSAWNSFKMS